MKALAIFAAMIPWLLFAGVSIAQSDGAIGPHSLQNAGLLWMLLSPLWFAGACLVAYREGQWSRQ